MYYAEFWSYIFERILINRQFDFISCGAAKNVARDYGTLIINARAIVINRVFREWACVSMKKQ